MERQELPTVRAARLPAYPEVCIAECPYCDAVMEMKHYHGEQTGTRCVDCGRAYIIHGVENE